MELPGGGARHRVVIVGGGFGGLPAARLLGHSQTDVVLIDAATTTSSNRFCTRWPWGSSRPDR